MRVVLDTNALVSALLFAGVSSKLVPLWQSRRIVALVFLTIEEWLRVLSYPQFKLRSIMSYSRSSSEHRAQVQLSSLILALGIQSNVR